MFFWQPVAECPECAGILHQAIRVTADAGSPAEEREAYDAARRATESGDPGEFGSLDQARSIIGQYEFQHAYGGVSSSVPTHEVVPLGSYSQGLSMQGQLVFGATTTVMTGGVRVTDPYTGK